MKRNNVISADEAVRVVLDGDTLAASGFVGIGFPEALAFRAIAGHKLGALIHFSKAAPLRPRHVHRRCGGVRRGRQPGQRERTVYARYLFIYN